MKNNEPSKCPCVDCITFTMCKNQIEDYFSKSHREMTTTNNMHEAYLCVLEPKCCLVHEFLSDQYDLISDIHKAKFNRIMGQFFALIFYPEKFNSWYINAYRSGVS